MIFLRTYFLRIFTTFLILFAFWLLLSGVYNTLTISLGVISSILVILLLLRMDVIDYESHPLHLAPGALLNYWPWLFKEIFFSGINVSRIILNPKLPVSPSVDVIPLTQVTDVGKSTFANSITLTPGTIAIEIYKDSILVHSIEKRLLIDLKSGEMDSRVSDFERAL
jgi:multicomponent Na+:H+ antiporter subunit E